MKKRVGAKLEMARFLQDTVAEMAKDMKGSKSGATQASAEQLYQFLKKVSCRCCTAWALALQSVRTTG